MTSQQILQSDLLDILFEKRNKLYGAYRLRRDYNSNLLKAIGGTALLVIALLFFAGPSGNKIEATKHPDKYDITPVVIVPEEKTKQVKQEQAAASSEPVRQKEFINQ